MAAHGLCIVGALIRGVIGLIGGPGGVVVGASGGAILGDLLATRDSGIKNERLEKTG